KTIHTYTETAEPRTIETPVRTQEPTRDVEAIDPPPINWTSHESPYARLEEEYQCCLAHGDHLREYMADREWHPFRDMARKSGVAPENAHRYWANMLRMLGEDMLGEEEKDGSFERNINRGRQLIVRRMLHELGCDYRSDREGREEYRLVEAPEKTELDS